MLLVGISILIIAIGFRLDTLTHSNKKSSPFKDKYVGLTLKTQMTVDDGMVTKSNPLSIRAYFVNESDAYYFLGDTPGNIDLQVLKSDVLVLETTSELTKESKKKDALDDFEIPENPFKIN